MIRGKSSLKYELIRQLVKRPGHQMTVSEMCRYAGVSRSGYYRWVAAAPKREQKERRDWEEYQKVLAAYEFRGYDKGSRGIHMRLLHEGIRMNRKKIVRLMRKYALTCPIRKANPYRRMAKAMRTNKVADNLLKREFRQHGPRKVLLTDITYLPLNGEFLYLSVVLDVCTAEALAHVLSRSLEVDFVLQTLQLLALNHPECINSDVMIHSDQGCHYTSVKFQELAADLGLRQSMSRRGNCWDNAPQESFFGHMKDELRKRSSNWLTFYDVKASIDDWIDYYNNDRYRWDLEKLSPAEYYTFITTGAYPDGMCTPKV